MLCNSRGGSVSMVTGGYKRGSVGNVLFPSDSDLLDAEALEKLLSSPLLGGMSQATRTKGGGVGSLGLSDKMICVECFRTKSDGDLKLPCQNPRCHFYRSSCDSNCLSSSECRADFHSNEVPILYHGSSFNKEVGHDRKSKLSCKPSAVACQNMPFAAKEMLWKNEPLSPALFNGSSSNVMARVQKSHSKSSPTASTSSSGGNLSIQRLLSAQASQIANKEKFQSRVMSLPDYRDSYLGREVGRDLVEDSFISSPLLEDYGERGEEEKVRVKGERTQS